jgi:hypothetical protein
MTTLKSKIEGREVALRVKFAPVGAITDTDVQRAIENLLSTFAPGTADYLVKTANANLSAERVVTDTATAVWDWGTSGQAKVNVVTSALDAAELLTLIKTVDGASSGLDADTLDGQSSAFYATASSVSDHLADSSDAHDASAISVADAGGNYAATDVEAALAEVMDALQAHEADATDAHDASAISIVDSGNNYSATEVESALAEVYDALETHIADSSDAHDASAISIVDSGGYISGTDVEAAIQEMAADIAALDQAVILKGTWDASSGSFPGGGAAQSGWSYIVSVSGTVDGTAFVVNDRILAITDNASTSTYASNWHKLDYTDQVLSVAGKTGAVTLAASDIASGTFDDARIAESNVTQHEAAIDHDALTNFVADEHVAHSGVTLTAGDGLTGGGTIAANRTFTVGASTSIIVGADDVQRAALTGAIAASQNSNSTTMGGGLQIVIDGGGSTITTGIKGDMRVPFACTLTGWTLLADQSGAIVIDVWRDTLANFPPTDADSITNTNEPEIAASGTNAEDTDLSNWTDVTLDAGDILRFNVDSVTSHTRVTLLLHMTKTG